MDGGLPSISKSGAGKNMESLSEFVGKFDWESIFEKFLPNNDNSPEPYQGPYALPNEQKVIPSNMVIVPIYLHEREPVIRIQTRMSGNGVDTIREYRPAGKRDTAITKAAEDSLIKVTGSRAFYKSK